MGFDCFGPSYNCFIHDLPAMFFSREPFSLYAGDLWLVWNGLSLESSHRCCLNLQLGNLDGLSVSCILVSVDGLLFPMLLDPHITVHYGYTMSLTDRDPHRLVERPFITNKFHIVPIHLLHSGLHALLSGIAGVPCRQFHDRLITRPWAFNFKGSIK